MAVLNKILIETGNSNFDKCSGGVVFIGEACTRVQVSIELPQVIIGDHCGHVFIYKLQSLNRGRKPPPDFFLSYLFSRYGIGCFVYIFGTPNNSGFANACYIVTDAVNSVIYCKAGSNVRKSFISLSSVIENAFSKSNLALIESYRRANGFTSVVKAERNIKALEYRIKSRKMNKIITAYELQKSLSEFISEIK